MKLKVHLLAAALALVALAPAVPASAAQHHHGGHHHAAGPSFPMKADEYRKLADKRIEGVRAIIDRKLDRHGVSPDWKKAIHRIFDESAKEVRAEVDKAAAHGTVTQEQAEKIKKLTIGLRARVRERLRAEKDPHASEKLAKADKAKADKAKPDKAKADKAKADKAPAKADEARDKAAKAGPKDKAAKATKTAKAEPAKATRPAKAAKAKATPSKGKAAKAAKHKAKSSGEDL